MVVLKFGVNLCVHHFVTTLSVWDCVKFLNCVSFHYKLGNGDNWSVFHTLGKIWSWIFSLKFLVTILIVILCHMRWPFLFIPAQMAFYWWEQKKKETTYMGGILNMWQVYVTASVERTHQCANADVNFSFGTSPLSPRKSVMLMGQERYPSTPLC